MLLYLKIVVMFGKMFSNWKDGLTCVFSGKASVKLDGVGVNAAITYTLAVKPDSEMIFE